MVPNSKKLVAPSILAADFASLDKEIKAAADAGADWIHVDVMDGHFVPNITIGVPVVASLKKISPLPLDVHLMIDRPERFIKDFIKAGSTYLTIHVESTQDVAGVLKDIRAQGAHPGITLRPGTDLASVEPYLDLVDLVLVMTVEPGFGGQKFLQDQVPKMTRLRALRKEKGLSFLIEVDGGVNAETLKFCKDADVLVAGSFVFGQKDYRESIASLKTGC